MNFRRFAANDEPALREIYKKAGYGFSFPSLTGISSWVAVSEGKVIGWAGAELKPEVSMIIDPDAGSAYYKMGIIQSFHKPLARDIRESGFEEVRVDLDPRFPSFGRHLIKYFHWWKGWDTLKLKVSQVIGAK